MITYAGAVVACTLSAVAGILAGYFSCILSYGAATEAELTQLRRKCEEQTHLIAEHEGLRRDIIGECEDQARSDYPRLNTDAGW